MFTYWPYEIYLAPPADAPICGITVNRPLRNHKKAYAATKRRPICRARTNCNMHRGRREVEG